MNAKNYADLKALLGVRLLCPMRIHFVRRKQNSPPAIGHNSERFSSTLLFRVFGEKRVAAYTFTVFPSRKLSAWIFEASGTCRGDTIMGWRGGQAGHANVWRRIQGYRRVESKSALICVTLCRWNSERRKRPGEVVAYSRPYRAARETQCVNQLSMRLTRRRRFSNCHVQ